MSVHETAQGWQVDRRDAYGKRIRLTFQHREAAEAVDRRMEEEARHQRQALDRFRKSVNLTLGEAVNEYLRSRIVNQRTRSTELARLQAFVRFLGSRPLADVTPAAVADYLKVRAGVLAPWTLYREAAMLRQVFRWFEQQWFIPANPVASIVPRPPRESRARALAFAESAALVANCGERLMSRVLLAHDAGLAATEAMTLRLRHISMAERFVDVHPIKHRAFRRVPMTERLFTHISQRTAGVDNPDALLIAHAMQEIRDKHSFMKLLRLRLGFHFRFHDLRHTFATRLAAVAQRPRLLQYLLGHHPVTPSEKYDHPTLDDCRRAIDLMDAARIAGEKEHRP